jgi:hypothetical protein
MSTVALAEQTVSKLEQVAEQRGVTVETLAEQVIQEFLLAERREAIRRESAAFRAMYPQLLPTYAGRYVAIYQGQLVDYDADQLTLYRRVSQQYGDAPILIKQVTASPDEVYTVRSPRLSFNQST